MSATVLDVGFGRSIELTFSPNSLHIHQLAWWISISHCGIWFSIPWRFIYSHLLTSVPGRILLGSFSTPSLISVKLTSCTTTWTHGSDKSQCRHVVLWHDMVNNYVVKKDYMKCQDMPLERLWYERQGCHWLHYISLKWSYVLLTSKHHAPLIVNIV